LTARQEEVQTLGGPGCLADFPVPPAKRRRNGPANIVINQQRNVYLQKENAMPRTKLSVPDVAEVGPDLWSNAIRAGDMLFISGQVARPFEGGTQIVGKNEYEQTKQIFSRIDRIIRAAGGTMDNLVKMTIYVVDIKNNTEVWRARREFFTGDFPASTLVEVRSLAKPDVLVEIETVAYLGRS
jgi:2-iminobutanoate/2-iminopropanoate deaminase